MEINFVCSLKYDTAPIINEGIFKIYINHKIKVYNIILPLAFCETISLTLRL